MSFLLKNHSLVAKSAAKVVPKGCERILTLVNSLKTLASEHVNLLCRKICPQQMVCEKKVRSKDVKIFGVKKL